VRRIVKRIRPWLLAALIIGATLLAIERWTLRDTLQVFAFVYYFAQPAVIAGIFLIAAGLAWRDRRRRVSRLALAAGLGFGALWASTSFAFRAVESPVAPHRAVVWNVMSGRLGWEAIYHQLGELNADVIVMVEAWEDPETAATLRRKYLPGFVAASEQGGLVILSRHGAADVSFGPLGRGSRFLAATLRMDGRRMRVMGVDIESDPRRFRKLPLTDLATTGRLMDDIPLLIAGDFNTPADSVHFDAMRTFLRNGFESVGAGYGPTWPSFAPVLGLDQFWFSQDIDARSCRGVWTAHSDHRPVVFEFELRAPSDPS